MHNNAIIINSIKLNSDLDNNYMAPSYEDILKEGFEGSQSLYTLLLNQSGIKRRARKKHKEHKEHDYPAKKYGQTQKDLREQKCTEDCFQKTEFFETECHLFIEQNRTEWNMKKQKYVQSRQVMTPHKITGNYYIIDKDRLRGFISPSFSVSCFLNVHSIPFKTIITENIKRKCDLIADCTHQTCWYPRAYIVDEKHYLQIEQLIAELKPIYNHQVYIWKNPVTQKYEYFENYLIEEFKKLINGKIGGTLISTRAFNRIMSEKDSNLSLNDILHIICLRARFDIFIQNDIIFRPVLEHFFNKNQIQIDPTEYVTSLLRRLYIVETNVITDEQTYKILYPNKDQIYEAIQYLIYCEQSYINKNKDLPAKNKKSILGLIT